MLVDELVELGAYGVDYDSICDDKEGNMTITDSNRNLRKVVDKGLTDDELMLLLAAKQTTYLRSIKSMITFFTVLTVISVCFCLYVGFKINSIF